MDAAARVFLDRLGQASDAPLPEQDLPHLEPVDEEALADCRRRFESLGDEPPPDLLHGLEEERVWVLVDLARNGSGLGRHRATVELRRLLRQISARAADHRRLLAELTRELERAVRAGGVPVVFQALLLEAGSGLRRLETPATGGRPG